MTSVTAEPTFLIHQATHQFVAEPIHFQVLQMNKSVFVWIGKDEAKLGDMSVAVPPFGNQSTAAATSIIVKGIAEQGKNLARSLALKYKQQFFVSLNLNNPDDMLILFIEKKLMELLKNIM
ncbi:hypothetical protein BDF20DRAFT_148092 [Mycotypha africana]|uniref:uncharacterized protein n=1 Tax=Mycotypha africana TaxID=64632 RepID=UPI002301E109|nr:uncharacterized protein BDF20DRAFT_148092 [Mycotypha africana]KAI8969165.1 hypothetical protein BDF20DRAFT_148092 [Mycotypha africana]